MEHKNCGDLLNEFSPMFWRTSQELTTMRNDLGSLQSAIRRKRYFPLLFGLTTVVTRFRAITEVTNIKGLLLQHDRASFSDYLKNHGLGDFFELLATGLFQIHYQLDRLSRVSTQMAEEMQEIAEAGQTEER
jgi:hypothetical protein